jgi:hypothetical protein
MVAMYRRHGLKLGDGMRTKLAHGGGAPERNMGLRKGFELA